MHKRMVYAVASHLSYKFYVFHIKDLGEIPVRSPNTCKVGKICHI